VVPQTGWWLVVAIRVHSMLLQTLNCVRNKASALRNAGQASYPFAAAVAQRLQHADAYEACGDALQEFRETVRDFAQKDNCPARF